MNPLVTSAWLAERLANPGNNSKTRVSKTRVLDATLPPVGVVPRVDTRARYLERHIPGAVFFDIEQHSDHATPLPHMLPAAEEFSRSMEALGVGSDMDIVVYEQEGVFSAPRAWWMLRTLGASNVFLLDGGLRAWIEAGLPLESGEPEHPPARFEAKLHREAVKDFASIESILARRTRGDGQIPDQILDARSAGRFTGAAPEPRPGLSSGHMPGAISVPFNELAEDGRLKSPERLRELFASKGVKLDQPITTTCGSGVTAAVVALGLEIAGARNVGLYDGSWSEYAQHPRAVIEKDA